MVKRRAVLFCGALATGVILVAGHAHAQAAGAVLDQIVGQFQTRSAGWSGVLRTFALHTFGILAGIELAWAAFMLAFRNADASEWLAEIVNQIFFLGFFLALLENAVTWSQAIVNGFRQAATGAGGVGVNPSDVLSAGVKLAGQVLHQMSIWNPSADAALMIAGIVILICFAVMSAEMILALVESFLIINMGVIFMAFGASRWTKEFAISTIRYAVSVGARLFVIQLLLSVGTGLIQDWAAQFNDVTDSSLCVLIGCSIVMLALVSVLPRTVQSMINGSSVAHGGALVGAAAGVAAGTVGAVAGVGALAAGTAGVGSMFGGAARLGMAQLAARDDAGTAPSSKIARVAAVAGYTAKNVGSGVMSDIGRRLSGQGARHGMSTWRVASDLKQRSRLIRDDLARPKPERGNTISGSNP